MSPRDPFNLLLRKLADEPARWFGTDADLYPGAVEELHGLDFLPPRHLRLFVSRVRGPLQSPPSCPRIIQCLGQVPGEAC